MHTLEAVAIDCTGDSHILGAPVVVAGRRAVVKRGQVMMLRLRQQRRRRLGLHPLAIRRGRPLLG